MKHGLWRLGKWKGIPIALHWSVLIGLAWFGIRYQRVVPALLTFFGFVALLAAHEFGHAIAARLRGVRVYEIRLYLLHGLCSHATPYRERDHVFIAWGGVIAQSAILMLALAIDLTLAKTLPAAEAAVDPLFYVFIQANAMMIVFNLMPIAPLDGYLAWRILRPLPSALSWRLRRAGAWFKRSMNIRKRRAIAKDAEHKVVDLLERIKKK